MAMANKRYFGMSDEELRRAAEENSAAWHGADETQRRALHDDNVWIRSILDNRTDSKSTFNPANGQWTEHIRDGSQRPTFTSPYQSQIDRLHDQLLNRRGFSYDYRQDPLYQQYAESYTRNGQRAMQDTLAQISARTGGLASSYAGAAGQQTYDNYMKALADKIPELQQAAYNMYLSEGDRMRSDLNMLNGLDATQYARYQDALGQYNTDRAFNYGTEQDAYNRQAQQAQTLAQYGDFSGFKALGYTDDQIARMQAAYQLQNQPRVVYRGGTRNDGEEGEDTTGGERINDASQLGEAAMNIANAMSRSNSPNSRNTFADRINDAWKSGKISPEEADYLLRAIGF